MLRAISFPVPVSEKAQRAIEWLERHVGGRYQGWCIDADGDFAVDILRPGGDRCERFRGRTLEEALSKARAAIREKLGAGEWLDRPAPAWFCGVVRRGEPAAFAIARALTEVDP